MNKIFTLIICALLSVASYGQGVQEVRFGNETSDTIRITELIDGCVAANLPTAEARVEYFARAFLGTPYAAHTLEGETEVLTVRVDSLDCTTFAETVLALAQTAGERRHSWRDFVFNLQRLRYRGGEVDGYASRLHYISDWAMDNIHRGNLKDAVYYFPTSKHEVKTIDFMTRNRESYPALSDSVTFERVKTIESGYRQHRFSYVSTRDLNKNSTKEAFRSGDVVALVTNIKGLDVTHMGVVVKDALGELYLLHASSTGGKVQLEERNLGDFMRKNRQWLGLRVFRLAVE